MSAIGLLPHRAKPEAMAATAALAGKLAGAGVAVRLDAGTAAAIGRPELGYDGANFGLWYDDIQFVRVAQRQISAAKKLGVRRIIVGECGHANKGLTVIADRIWPDASALPRESYLPLLDAIVSSGRLELDPRRNAFPVTLHDPCNIVRLMGITRPQRRILHAVCSDFREMEPHGVDNYCCGGGGGLGLFSSAQAQDWTAHVSGRMKMRQVLEAFSGVIDNDKNKYLCAPCTNCKVQMRNLFEAYSVREKASITYGGLVDLVVNAMPAVREPYVSWVRDDGAPGTPAA